MAPPSAGTTATVQDDKHSNHDEHAVLSLFGWAVAVPLYLTVKVGLALRFPMLQDCDEVYNYWEPLHYLVYGSGQAQQTWEYAHEFALRTYAFVVPLRWWAAAVLRPHAVPLLLQSPRSFFSYHHRIHNNGNEEKIALFLCLRATLALCTAAAELQFLYSLASHSSLKSKKKSQQHITMTKTIVGGTALLFLTSTGPAHAGAAYLPSAAPWMAAWCYCAAQFLRGHHGKFAAAAVAATLATGWPFGAVSVAPMGAHILWKQLLGQDENRNSNNNNEKSNKSSSFSILRLAAFLVMIGLVTVAVQAAVVYIDFGQYGATVSATLNIFTYNAGNSGDELYGVEPTSYYLKNLLLNLNLAAPLGCLAIPVYLLCPSLQRHHQQEALSRVDWNWVSVLLSLPAWLAITLPRPHKEERFLFPVYPVLLWGAVLTFDTVVSRLVLPVIATAPRQRRNLRFWFHCTAVWIPFVVVSMCRTAALWKYYAVGPLEIYGALPSITATTTTTTPIRVCTCGEWYRFPSSFFLPQGYGPLGFLPSSFTGQLPQPFSEYGSTKESQAVLQPFNDRNAEQIERYVQPGDCQYVVDLASNDDCTAQFDAAASASTRLQVKASAPFLNAHRTTSTLHRTLYVPFLHKQAVAEGVVVYDQYLLYEVVS